jgi:hypothetical protein
MTVNFRTRVELTCWDLVIPMMTKLRHVRTVSHLRFNVPISFKKFITQLVLYATIGMLIGIGISAIYAYLH